MMRKFKTNIMPKYYKFIFALLLSVVVSASVVNAQTPTIDSIKRTTTYTFPCDKYAPIDLFKAMDIFISPENGYWGDIYGVPYNGKQSAVENIKERPFTNGNVFDAVAADTGYYKFYFYVTSSKGYCGLKTGTRFILDLYLTGGPCVRNISGEINTDYRFCYGTNYELTTQYEYKTMTMEELLFTRSENPHKWKVDTLDMNSDWVKLEVYTDSARTELIGGNDFTISTTAPSDPFNGPNDPTEKWSQRYYVRIYPTHGSIVDVDSVDFTVFPQSTLEVYYTPTLDAGREFDIDDNITITVENPDLFDAYYYFLNNKELNKYYMGGDTTKNEIILNALVFSGVEDYIEVIATDTNRCVAKWSDNVVVNVPFPSAFTPDGDGINDIFFGGEKFRNREFHLEVFNRWGNRLYYGESGWDGKYKGDDVPPGTYSYVLILKNPDGSTRTIKGTVAVVRNKY